MIKKSACNLRYRLNFLLVLWNVRTHSRADLVKCIKNSQGACIHATLLKHFLNLFCNIFNPQAFNYKSLL